MPNNMFGNPFAIPQVQATHLKAPSLPDPSKSIARLIQMQMRQAALAARAARAERSELGKPMEVMVPQKDGTKKAVLVYGHSPTERKMAAQNAIAEATQKILTEDTELQKELANFEGLSVPGQKEATDRIRQNILPRLSRVTGISGEDLAKQYITGLEAATRKREKDIADAGVGTQLIQGGKQLYRNIRDAIAAIGKSPAEQLAIGRASAEEAAKDLQENAFQDELQRLNAENRSTIGFQLSNPFRTGAMHATGLAGMMLPAIAGGAVAGPVGFAVGGAIGAGLPAAGEAIERVATDPKLNESQKEEAVGQTALASGVTAGALGAIPVGPANAIRALAARRAVAKAFPQGAGEAVARSMTANATAAEATAAEQAFLNAQRASWTPNWYQSIGMHGANAAALGGAFQVGSNAAYGLGTGQDVPLTENLGEAVWSGAMLGVPFGIGGRVAAWKRGQRPGLNPMAQPDWTHLEGSIPYVNAANADAITSLREASGHVPNYDTGAPLSQAMRRQIVSDWRKQPMGKRAYTPEEQAQMQAYNEQRLADAIYYQNVQTRAAKERADWAAWNQNRASDMTAEWAKAEERKLAAEAEARRFGRPLIDTDQERLAAEWARHEAENRTGTQQDLFDSWNIFEEAQRRAKRQTELSKTLYNNPVENPNTRQNTDIASERSLAERGGRPLYDQEEMLAPFVQYFEQTPRPSTNKITERVETAIRNGQLNNAEVEALLARYYDPNKKATAQSTIYKGIKKGIANANRTGNASEPAPSMEPNEPTGQGRTDTTNPLVDSPVPADTETVAPAPANPPAPEVVSGGAEVEGRRYDGAPAQDTGQIEATPGAVNEQGLGGRPSPVRESNLEPTAPDDAAGGAGERGTQSPTEQRPGNAGNAKQANARLIRRDLAWGYERDTNAIPLGPTEEAPAPNATPEQVRSIERENFAETPIEDRIQATDSDAVVLEKLTAQLQNAGRDNVREGQAADDAAIGQALFRTLGDLAGTSTAEQARTVTFSYNEELKPQVENALNNVIQSHDQEAWHGTPFEGRIDRLSTDYLGSGEGAQVHGWGIYAALSEKIAKKQYQHRLAREQFRLLYDGKPFAEVKNAMRPEHYAWIQDNLASDLASIGSVHRDINWLIDDAHTLLDSASKITPQTPAEKTLDFFNEAQETILLPQLYQDFVRRFNRENNGEARHRIVVDYAQRLTKELPDYIANQQELLTHIEKLDKERVSGKGQRLRLEIPDDDVMLREDAFFDAQPKKVQDALTRLYREQLSLLEEKKKNFLENGNKNKFDELSLYDRQKSLDNLREYMLGGDGRKIYQAISDIFSNNIHVGSEFASKLLLKHGIKGIRYHGGIDGECAVLFDGIDAKILERFYDQYGGRGHIDLYSDGTARILFGNTADASTAIHEFEHLFIERVGQMLRDGGIKSEAKRVQVEKDLLRLAEWGGMKEPIADVLAWERDVHEKIARGFEAYVRTGKAPTPELESIFARMKKFLVQLYQKAKELIGANRLPKDIREIFDRQLTGYKELAPKVESTPAPKVEPALNTPEAQETLAAVSKPVYEKSEAGLRDAIKAAGANKFFIDKFNEAPTWKEKSEMLRRAGIELPEELRTFINEHISEARKAEEATKTFDDKTYEITKRNITPFLVRKMKERGISEEDTLLDIENGNWKTLRDELSFMRELTPEMEDKLNRLEEYADKKFTESLEGAVQEAVKDPTRENLAKAQEVIAETEKKVKELTGDGKKVEEAKLVLEEAAKTENEPIATELNELRDAKLLETKTGEDTSFHEKYYIDPAVMAEVFTRTVQAIKDGTLRKNLGKKAFNNLSDEELLPAMLEAYEKYYTHDPTLTKQEKRLFEKGVGGAVNKFSLFPDPGELIEGKKPDDYNIQVIQAINSHATNTYEAMDFMKQLDKEEAAAKQAQQEKQNAALTANGVYEKSINAWEAEYKKKAQKIWKDKIQQGDFSEKVFDVYLKKALGEKLSPQQERLYNEGTAGGIQGLVVNKAVVNQEMQNAKVRGFDQSPIEALKSDPPASADKMNETKFGC